MFLKTSLKYLKSTQMFWMFWWTYRYTGVPNSNV